jgi:glycosyltransferase involved in cell wall biosynthesis
VRRSSERGAAAGLVGPIRILFVIGTLDVGGAETQLVELITRLDRGRFDPVLCCLATTGPLIQRLLSAGVRVHILGFRGFRNGGSWLGMLPHVVSTLWRFFRIMRSERPSIVHGVLFWAYVLGAFAGRAAGVPVVIASRRSLGLFKADKPHYLWLERRANRLTDLFIANSEAVRRDTLQRERIDPARVLVVHNGVDFSRFGQRTAPSDSTDLGTRPRVIVVSNLIHYKGHEFFLRAWARVVERFPEATALLVGEGVMRSSLDSMARELGIAASVKFLGRRTDVANLLAAADLYVHPSLQEGYSNAVLEAMAMARPVVATSVGGNTEAIADGETGLLVPPGDPSALTIAMLRLLEDPPYARELGRRAAVVVRERLDIGSVVHAYEDIYSRLAAGERLQYHPGTEGVTRCAV